MIYSYSYHQASWELGLSRLGTQGLRLSLGASKLNGQGHAVLGPNPYLLAALTPEERQWR